MRISDEIRELSAGKDFLNEVDQAAKKAREFDALLRAREQSLASPFYTMDKFLEETGGETGRFSPKAEINRSLGELREAEVLAMNVSSRLLENGITQQAWQKATAMERNHLMDSAFRIMAEEIHMPPEVLSKLAVLHSGTEETVAGSCNLFVMRDAEGNIVLNPDVLPTVEMRYDFMYMDDLDLPLRCLFHQATIMMEQVCATETKLSAPDAALWDSWVSEVSSEIDGHRPRLEGEMQKYARKTEEVFGTYYEKLAELRSIQKRQISFRGSKEA